MVNPDIDDVLLYLVRALSSDDDWYVTLRGIKETELKKEFVGALKRHIGILNDKLNDDVSENLDTHKQASAICMAVLDLYPLKPISGPIRKKRDYYFPNEYIAMQLGRYHVTFSNPDIQKPRTLYGYYKPELIHDHHPYNHNFLYMLWEEKHLSYCAKYDVYDRIDKRCEGEACQWRQACSFGRDHNYLALSKLFYHFENDILPTL